MRDDQLILTANADFADFALRELRAAVEGVVQVNTLADGVFLAEISGSFWALAEEWRQAPPIFVRHICPVQVCVPLTGQIEDLDALGQAVLTEIGPLIDPEMAFSIQTRTFCELAYKRFDVNNALAKKVHREIGAPLDVRSPLQIISVVCAPADAVENPTVDGAACVAFVGISLAVHNLSDWAGGMRRFAREDEQVSRSEFKLLEAVEVFDLDLSPRGVALDLGAAPGGWTRVLRQHEQYVTAVDPGELHPSIGADPRVRHMRMTAEEYLANEPDQFDIIVNDMRIDASDSARLMVSYARHLYAHGWALVTLKLPAQGRTSLIDRSLAILQQAYAIAGVRQLFHNRSEITVYLKPL